MKNRGFTLIELLAVIAVMGIAGTIITINLVKTFNDTNDMQCEQFVTEVEEAACVYAGLSTKSKKCKDGCEITIRELLKEGLLKEQKDKCFNDDLYLDDIVNVYWIDGEKVCKYQGE